MPKKLQTIHLKKATLADHPTIQNMARFYVYDMSRYCGHIPDWECPENGLFECVDLKEYFTNPNNHAYVIKVGNELAGFALINKVGSTKDIDWNIGEFFILAKFQGHGMGQKIARELFDRHIGIWEVSAMPENLHAIGFWQKVVSNYSSDKYVEEKRLVAHPEPHQMVIWRFSSSDR